MIHITRDYYIDADKYSFSVYKRNVAKESGKERFDAMSHHSTLKACIDRINDYLAQDSIMFNWGEKVLCRVWQEFREDVLELIDTKLDLIWLRAKENGTKQNNLK